MGDVDVQDNTEEVLGAMAEQLGVGLEEIGLLAEGYAKRLCAVDTGRLRNSITHATAAYSGVGTYQDNRGNSFTDATANGTPEENAVYIGTNVDYAVYVEMGTVHTPAQPFLKPAATEHSDEYKRVLEAALRDG
nr:MAG TPA: putative tail component [Caudoviricetes sp.]